jgi:PAS domain S-box-containing protein
MHPAPLLLRMPPTLRIEDFKAMIESAPEAVIAYDFRTFLYLNPFAAERLESDVTTLIGQPVMNFVHESSKPMVAQRLRQLAESGVAGPPLEVRFVSSKGNVIQAEVVSVPIVLEGKPAVLGLIRDISERLETLNSLRESEERFANAFRYSAHGMAFVSLDGRWLRANDSLCEMLGYTEAELRESSFQTVTHPEDVADDVAQLDRLVKGEMDTYQRVKRYHRKNGETIWVSLAVSAVHSAEGDPMYFITQVEDITAQREMAERSLQAQRLAGIAETAVTIAHEMNNALTVLVMNAELLAAGVAAEEVAEISAEILAASNRIAATVHRLQNVADLKSVEYLGDTKMLDLSSGPKQKTDK